MASDATAVSSGRAIETLLARSAVYSGMAMALRRPDGGTAMWRAGEEHRRLPDIARLLGGKEQALVEATERLAARLHTVALADVAREHDQVFGHAVQGAAPPYELEYGEAHSHRQPQELGDIAAFYQAFALQSASAAHERPDYIGTECEFLQWVLYKQACALDEGHADHAATCQAAVKQFLADHLGRWAPAFALRLSRAASAQGVLAAAAAALLEWVIQECAREGVAAGSQDLPLRSLEEPQDACATACGSEASATGCGNGAAP